MVLGMLQDLELETVLLDNRLVTVGQGLWMRNRIESRMNKYKSKKIVSLSLLV